MATLIGEPGEQASNVVALGKIIAVQFEALLTGTLEELRIIPGQTWNGTTAYLAIAEDNAGAPGTILGTKESAEIPKEKVPYGLAGFSVSVTKGTKYWLLAKAGLAANTAKLLGKAGGSSTVRKSTKTFGKIEATSEWEAAEAKGPLSFWGLGTESGGSETKIVTAAVHGAGASKATALKVGLATAAVTGAGATKAAALKVATTTALAHGAGASSASTVKVSTPTALVHGAGNANTASLKIATPSALVHGAGRATVTLTASGEVRIVAAAVHGAGRSSVSVVKIATPIANVTGGGGATVGAQKVTTATASVHGAGRATVTLTQTVVVPEHCNITLGSQKALTITLASRKALTTSLGSRPALEITLEAQ